MLLGLSVSGYWGTGVLGYRGTGVLGHWGTGALGYWGTGVLKQWGLFHKSNFQKFLWRIHDDVKGLHLFV